MSAARYFVVDVNSSDEVPLTFVKIVGSSLGFILPFVSFGFFVKGYDALASRFWLARSKALVRRYTRLRRKKKVELDKKRRELEAAREELAELETPSYVQRAIGEKRRKFLAGYREGVREVLGSAGRGSSLVKNLRPVLVERVLQSWSR